MGYCLASRLVNGERHELLVQERKDTRLNFHCCRSGMYEGVYWITSAVTIADLLMVMAKDGWGSGFGLNVWFEHSRRTNTDHVVL